MRSLTPKTAFLVFETTEELRNSVAWLYAYVKDGKDYPSSSIQVIPRAGRTEGKLLLAGKENKVARIPNPFGEFGEMLKLEGLDRVPKSELKHLYRKDENIENDDQQPDIFKSQETSRKEELAVASSQAIARKDELAFESKTQHNEETLKENADKQNFASSKEETRKGEVTVASLQETARKREFEEESSQEKVQESEFAKVENFAQEQGSNTNMIEKLPTSDFQARRYK